MNIKTNIVGSTRAQKKWQSLVYGIFNHFGVNTFESRFFILLLTFTLFTSANPINLRVPWPEFIARQDPTWNRIPFDFFEGPFVGNGKMGTILFKDTPLPNTLRFEIGRTDVYDHRTGRFTAHERARLPIGQLLLTPVGKITEASFRTDLWNAEIRGELKTAKGSIQLRCFTPSGFDVILIDLKTSGDEPEPKIQFRPQRGNSSRFIAEPSRDKNYTYQENPPPLQEKRGEFDLAIQPLLAGGDYATAWTSTPTGPNSKTIWITTAYRWAEKKTPIEGSAEDAIQTLKSAIQRGGDSLEKSHREWWHAYYPKSFITLPEPRIESFYWIQLYKLASATRADQPVVDLMGPWFKPTIWAAYWQNLNTQLPYYLPNVINHPEFCEAPARQLERHIDELIANVPKEWQSDSAALGNPTGYDTLAAPAPGPANPKPGQAYNFIALPWLSQQFYLYTRFTGDDNRLKKSVYPLMKRTFTSYLHVIKKEEDGLYHLPLCFSDEYGKAEDTSQDLGLLRWGLTTLIATAEKFKIDEPNLPRWREVLQHLAPLPIDPETGIMIGRNQPFAKPHRHSSHLFAFFPLHALSAEDQPELKPLLEKSLQTFTGFVGDECVFKFTAASSLWSSLGNGEEGLKWLKRSLEILPNGPTITANTLYSENGWPTFETPISAARSLTDFLIQSQRGVIRIFPACPTEWKDLAFHDLRAEGPFLLSAKRSEGKTVFVRIKSLLGGSCRLRADLPDSIQISGIDPAGVKRNGNDFTLTLQKNQEVLLSTSSSPATIEPLSPPRNPDDTWGVNTSNPK